MCLESVNQIPVADLLDEPPLSGLSCICTRDVHLVHEVFFRFCSLDASRDQLVPDAAGLDDVPNESTASVPSFFVN